MIAHKVKMAVQGWTHTLVWSGRHLVSLFQTQVGRITNRRSRNLSQPEATLPARLQAFTARFTAHSTKTDAEFDALAKSLRGLYQTAQTLARLVREQLGCVRAALQTTPISGPDGLATAPLQDLRDGLAETAIELDALRAVGDELCRVSSRVSNIEKLGLSIRTSVINFAVESARTEECQQAFGSFAADLRALGDRISKIAAALDHQASGTRLALAEELKTLDGSHGQLCGLARQLETTARATAAAAQQMLDQVLHGLQQAEAHMRTITQQAGEAVFYLQFGDIIRQKSEHISITLGEIEAKLRPGPGAGDYSVQAVGADRIMAIQIGQLELIQAEIMAAQNKLMSSFHGLTQAGKQLREALNQWEAQASNQPTELDSLAAFKADVLRMEELHRHGLQLRQGTHRSKQNAVKASDCLAGYVAQVKTLNTDIHLHALNAIVRTSALGSQGATLSVLSMYVDSLYRESRDVAADLVTGFESVLRQTRTQAADNTLAETASQDGQLHTRVARIESACHNCRTAITAANTLVTEQYESLQNSQELLGGLAQHAAVIADQITELKALRAVLAPHVGNQTVPLPPESELRDRYTMQSEREIHDRLIQLTPTTVTATTNSDDNLELFTPATPPELTTSIQPDPPPPTGSHATAVIVTAPELGENVELF